jgi:hypothetical protein
MSAGESDEGTGVNCNRTGHLIWKHHGQDLFRCTPSGAFFIQDRRVTDDNEIFQLFKDFLSTVNNINKTKKEADWWKEDKDGG